MTACIPSSEFYVQLCGRTSHYLFKSRGKQAWQQTIPIVTPLGKKMPAV